MQMTSLFMAREGGMGMGGEEGRGMGREKGKGGEGWERGKGVFLPARERL